MLRNYLKTALRSVFKNKIFSIINIMGLAIGMTACLLITHYVMHELSYDQFQSKKDRIFRIQLDRHNKGVITTRWAGGCAGIGPDLKTNFPEVMNYVRMIRSNALLANGDVFFKEDHVYYTSEDFFKIFSVKLIKGVDSTVLKEPYKMVVSQSLAKKYFGNEDPIGKTLRNNGNTDYEIVGLYEDVPENSHMKIDALLSFATYVALLKDNAAQLNSWQWDGFMTYVLLDERTNPAVFKSKLPAFVEKHEGQVLKQDDAGMIFNLEPITDIHLYSPNLMEEFGPNGNGKAVYFLAIIAGFILLIAWINYINLATAKSMERAREVGVRKVMGSFRSQLMRQFLLESFLIKLGSFLLALVLFWLLLPSFSDLTGRKLADTPLQNPLFWLGAMGVFAIGVLLAGLYPAFVMSGFKPVQVLKGHFQASARGNYLRKGLVIFQFVSSITLIVGTFTVYRQIAFMRDSDLGVTIEQTLVLRGPNITDSTYVHRFDAFQNDLAAYPEITKVCSSTSVPGRQPDWNAGGIRRVSERPDQSNQYRVLGIDYDFVSTFQIQLKAGRDFSKDLKTDESAVLFNESAVKLMGFKSAEEALEEKIYFWGDTFKIVGVLKDYRQESLKKDFDPLIFRLIPAANAYYSLRIKTDNIPQTIRLAEEKWKSYFPGNPFQFFFLDEYYDQQYKADQQFGKVFGVFAGLAIFIACLGLFGLSSYTVVQRTKEIGVRKVLGASVVQVITLLCKDFALLVVMAVVVAVPVSWFVMNDWLSEFANRIVLSWWIFVLPVLVVVLIAWITISTHTFRAASANPVESLRYE